MGSLYLKPNRNGKTVVQVWIWTNAFFKALLVLVIKSAVLYILTPSAFSKQKLCDLSFTENCMPTEWQQNGTILLFADI